MPQSGRAGGKEHGGDFRDLPAADGDDAVRSRRVNRLLGPLGIAYRVRRSARDVVDDVGDAKQALLGFAFGMMVGEQDITAAARPG